MLNYAILVIIMQKTRFSQKCQIEPFCTKVANAPLAEDIVCWEGKNYRASEKDCEKLGSSR